MSSAPLPSAQRANLVIACAMAVLTISMGVRATSGLLLPPMTQANGWTRESFAFAFAVQNLVWGLAAPLFGALADRFGSGRAIATGALFYVAGLVLMRFAGTPLGLDFSMGVLVGLGLSGTTFGVLLGVVARNVPIERRSAALGLAAAGGSIGQFVMLPVGQQFIGAFEWYGALFALAAVAALMVPLAAGLTGRPDAAQSDQSMGEAIREAVGHRSFHFLFWSFFTCGFHTAFITLHFPAYTLDVGLPITVGMTAIALIGLFNIIGTYVFGVLGGRHSKKGLLAWLYFVRGFVLLGLVLAPKTPLTIYLFAAAMGLLWLGTVPLTNGLVAQIYGIKFVGLLSGVIFFGHQIGSFLGAWLGGYAFDTYQSYNAVWILSVIVSFTAGLFCLPIDEQPLARAPRPLASSA